MKLFCKHQYIFDFSEIINLELIKFIGFDAKNATNIKLHLGGQKSCRNYNNL